MVYVNMTSKVVSKLAPAPRYPSAIKHHGKTSPFGVIVDTSGRSKGDFFTLDARLIRTQPPPHHCDCGKCHKIVVGSMIFVDMSDTKQTKSQLYPAKLAFGDSPPAKSPKLEALFDRFGVILEINYDTNIGKVFSFEDNELHTGAMVCDDPKNKLLYHKKDLARLGLKVGSMVVIDTKRENKTKIGHIPVKKIVRV